MIETISIPLSYEPHPTDNGATVADVLVRLIQNRPQNIRKMRDSVEVMREIIARNANHEPVELPKDLANEIYERLQTETFSAAHPVYLETEERLRAAVEPLRDN